MEFEKNETNDDTEAYIQSLLAEGFTRSLSCGGSDDEPDAVRSFNSVMDGARAAGREFRTTQNGNVATLWLKRDKKEAGEPGVGDSLADRELLKGALEGKAAESQQ